MNLQVEWHEVGTIAGAVAVGGTLASLVLRGWLGTRYAERRELVVVQKDVAAHGEQLATLQEAVKHLPTHDQLRLIDRDLAALRGETGAQTAILTGMRRQLEIVQEHLLKANEDKP